MINGSKRFCLRPNVFSNKEAIAGALVLPSRQTVQDPSHQQLSEKKRDLATIDSQNQARTRTGELPFAELLRIDRE
jgi:hypothetical protein